MRIVFMGTPDFAVESLKALVENKYNVVGVVTMPDKPSGRGHKIQFSPVKNYALEAGIPVLQPEKLKDEEFLAALKALNADLQIVVAFRMLPELVWNMPPMGTFNLHASLLPQYRGAAPINWAVINGEKETGITTFFLKHEIDTGGILLQEKIAIEEDDNAGDVHDKLMCLGASLVCKTVDLIKDGNYEVKEQSEFFEENTELKSAPKIFKETCQIKPEMDLTHAHLLVRGMSPYPTAWVDIQIPGNVDKIVLKLYETSVDAHKILGNPGDFVHLDKNTCGLQLSGGVLVFKSVQAPGKKRMSAAEWLRGLH